MIVLYFLFGGIEGGSAFAAPMDFPKNEITIIVPYGPGGGSDIVARGVAKTMTKYLGVPIVVVNTVGAGGARGIISLYSSSPDGYTIGIAAPGHAVDQLFEKRDYDINKFSYIGRAQHSPNFFLVKSDSPFRSVKDFKAFGKVVRHGAFSLTATPTVAGMVVAKREGFPLAMVGGYKGAADTILGLMRGEVEFVGPCLSNFVPYLQEGKTAPVRPIVTIDQKRSPDFPDVPTIGEIGYPDLETCSMDFWFMAPPGVPKDRLKMLDDALIKTVRDREFVEWAKKAGVDPGPLNGEETFKFVSSLLKLIEQYKGDIEKYLPKK